MDPPTDFPVFREQIRRQDFEAKAAVAAAGIKVSQQQAIAGRPAVGVRVIKVQERLAGYRLGIREGDLITTLNGQQLWLASAIPYSEKPPKLEYYSIATGKMKSGTLSQGPPGVELVDHYQPELAFLQSKSRDAEWNEDVYVGIVSRAIDPDLAETAWFHAFRKGYRPDVHAAAAGLEIAMNQGRTEIADLYSRFLPAAEQQNVIAHPILRYRAAAANFRLRQLLALTVDYPYLFSSNPTIQYLLDLHAKRSQDQREQPAPHQSAEKFQEDNLLPRLEAYRHVGIRNHLPGLQRGEKVTIKAPPAHFQEVMLKTPEPVSNVDISMEFTWQPEPGDHRGFLSQLELQLQTGKVVVTTEPNVLPLGTTWLGWSRYEAGEGILFGDSELRYPAPAVAETPEPRVHKLRIICVDGQGELYLDEQRLLYLPVAQHTAPAWLYIKVVGSKLIIHNFKFSELIEDYTRE